jgi:Ca-activated chloride channel family protein
MIFFAGGNYLLSETSLPATEENINLALSAIDKQDGGGGTELLSALERALRLPGTDDFARTFVIATDGYVSVEKEAFDLIRNNLSNANFFAFGIGSSVNRYIIEGIAHVGMGEPFIVLNENEALDKAGLFRKYIQYPVLTNIDVNFTDFNVYDVEPPNVPDVFAERPVILFGKYNDQAAGRIELSGFSGGYNFDAVLDVSGYAAAESNAALRYLWARYRIQLLDDYGSVNNYWYNPYDSTYTDSLKEEITRLGLKYNLLTQYTSFIAVDSIIRNDSGTVITVKQPLPMPEGVSDYAIGDRSSSYANTAGGFWGAPTAGNYSVNAASVNTCIQQCYPNPFSSSTFIRFFINKADEEKVKQIKIFNCLGELVDQIEITEYREGLHEYEINFREKYQGLPAGFYHCQLIIGNSVSDKVSLIYLK